MLWPTIALAGLLFLVGYRLAGRRALALAWAAALLLAVPALLYALYYLHLFDGAVWFYHLRSAPGSELAASGAGVVAGMACRLLAPPGRRGEGTDGLPLLGPFLTGLIPGCLLLLLAGPYAKPVLLPLRMPLEDRWSEGVCIQSTPSTCGPSSAATLLRRYGRGASERELVRECYTSGSGTENWYLARALRRRGLRVGYTIVRPQPGRLEYPAIAGTDLGGEGGAGHFIAVLDRQGDRYVVGDPLSGRFVLTLAELKQRYYFTGFFMLVRPGA